MGAFCRQCADLIKYKRPFVIGLRWASVSFFGTEIVGRLLPNSIDSVAICT